MKELSLYDLDSAGIIFPFKTGFRYTNQVGGGACFQKQLEGVFLPISHDHSAGYGDMYDRLEHRLDRVFRNNEKVDPCIADKIDAVLQSYPTTKGICVDRTKLDKSCEAWVYVTLNDNKHSLYRGFSNQSALLTWPNSD